MMEVGPNYWGLLPYVPPDLISAPIARQALIFAC
jgi:hypothetical protein